MDINGNYMGINGKIKYIQGEILRFIIQPCLGWQYPFSNINKAVNGWSTVSEDSSFDEKCKTFNEYLDTRHIGFNPPINCDKLKNPFSSCASLIRRNEVSFHLLKYIISNAYRTHRGVESMGHTPIVGTFNSRLSYIEEKVKELERKTKEELEDELEREIALEIEREPVKKREPVREPEPKPSSKRSKLTHRLPSKGGGKLRYSKRKNNKKYSKRKNKIKK
jgi:hypothetical protein